MKRPINILGHCMSKTVVPIAGAVFAQTITFIYAARVQKKLAEIADHTCYQNHHDTTLAINDKIMQPFFTTKPTGEGTGLGLSLSYDIVVKGHGGTITIDSRENEFTAITVSIPVL